MKLNAIVNFTVHKPNTESDLWPTCGLWREICGRITHLHPKTNVMFWTSSIKSVEVNAIELLKVNTQWNRLNLLITGLQN